MDESRKILWDPLTLVQPIPVGIRNDQMFELSSLVSFGVGSNTRISGGGSNLDKKMPHMERLLLQLIRVDQ